MSLQENKELIRRFVDEIYNQKNLDKYLEFVGEAIAENGSDHLRQFFTAFPDSHTTLLDIFGEEDKIVGRLLIHGTHKGPFAGRPATGKKIRFHSIRIYRIVNGKIVESWAMQNQLGLMEQLGFIQKTGQVNWATGDDD